jgi:uncharacterized protein (TIGR01319 family)
MPTPSSVLKAATVLAKGFEDESGFGDLMLIDIGGATTDIYSIASGIPKESNVIQKGLPEPFAKRTVEGDLGLRYTSKFLLDEVGIGAIEDITGLTSETILRILDIYTCAPNEVDYDDEEVLLLDTALAQMATLVATNRHCGTLESHYTPLGQQFLQVGKDLREVRTIIGTGGPMIHNGNSKSIFEQSLYSSSNNILKPTEAQFYLDKNYILASMGLLCDINPKLAKKLMKENLKIIN